MLHIKDSRGLSGSNSTDIPIRIILGAVYLEIINLYEVYLRGKYSMNIYFAIIKLRRINLASI